MFGVRWSRLHEAAYRSVVARDARRSPDRPRSGCAAATNTSSFELVARTERSLVAGGRATLPSQVASAG